MRNLKETRTVLRLSQSALARLPALVQQLCEAGAYLQRVLPDRGVVSALVPEHEANFLAHAIGRDRTDTSPARSRVQ